MKLTLLGAAVFATALAGGASAQETAMTAQVNPRGGALIPASFQLYMFGGRQYCWYASAWRGPGWYWCGYAWRDGLGWGGPRGWRGWRDRGGHGGGHFDGGHFGGGHGGGEHFGGGHGGGGHFGGGGHGGGGHR